MASANEFITVLRVFSPIAATFSMNAGGGDTADYPNKLMAIREDIPRSLEPNPSWCSYPVISKIKPSAAFGIHILKSCR